jgi:hypothetical protein
MWSRGTASGLRTGPARCNECTKVLMTRMYIGLKRYQPCAMFENEASFFDVELTEPVHQLHVPSGAAAQNYCKLPLSRSPFGADEERRQPSTSLVKELLGGESGRSWRMFGRVGRGIMNAQDFASPWIFPHRLPDVRPVSQHLQARCILCSCPVRHISAHFQTWN